MKKLTDEQDKNGDSMTDENLPQAPTGEFVMFSTEDGQLRIECRFESETLWLPQAAIANLYQVTPQAITQHIKAIYEDGELEQSATCKPFLQVRQRDSASKSKHDALQLIGNTCCGLSGSFGS